MKKITIIDDEKYSLYCYPEEKIIHHVILQPICGEEFRNLMSRGAEAFIKYECRKWLSDDRGNSKLCLQDLIWGLKNWEYKILNAGWRYWGLILPEKQRGMQTMQKIVQHFNVLKVEVKTFEKPDAALAWLIAK